MLAILNEKGNFQNSSDLFTKNGNNLNVITTNGGQDNITNAQYAAADDKIFAASGFTFSLESNGNLIATI